MTDDLDRLKAALQSAPPAPSAKAKAAHLRLAGENFERLQGTRDAARQTTMRPTLGTRLSHGARTMFNTLTSRAGLAATTGLVTAAIALVVILPENRAVVAPPDLIVARERAEAPATTALADEGAAPGMQAEPMVSPLPAPPVALRKSMPAGEVANITGGLMAPETAVLPGPVADTERFASADPNPVKVTAEAPVSTFSIDVDTASYAIVRSSLMAGQLPPRDTVRVEEMINYFPYDYTAPDADGLPFRPTVTVSPTPWNSGTELVHIALQGMRPALAERPPLNLVFLIDTSGSMQDADKLPLLKQSFRLMLSALRPEDEVAVVTYAGSAGQVLAPTPAADRAAILAALERLEAGGSTAGQAGLQQAYATAESMAGDGEVSRVILATDGDFNVGLSDPGALKTYIEGKRDRGTYLSVLGFGRGNLDDATMQALAQNGNGQAAYIDTLSEARKVLVDQLSGALYPIANDVKVQVEFNPATVAEYRLIGYETRALNREDFNNDAVDAGDIGAGHQVTALYEVTPMGSPAALNDTLRYQPSVEATGMQSELGFLRLRFKAPGSSESRLIEAPIPVGTQAPGTDARFAIAVAGFGQLLTGGTYLGGWGYDDAIALANGARGADAFGYRAEAVTLMRLAQSLSQQ